MSRPLPVTIMVRRTAALAGALALVVSLAGCIGGSPAGTPPSDAVSPTPTPTPESTPTAQPVDPLTTVVGLVARPEGLELRDVGGTVLATIDYMSSPADAVGALTTVFDEPPVDEPYAGTNHHPGGVFHTWDQFVLDERFYDEQRRQANGYDWLVWPRLAVYFDGPAADGVVLSTSSGLQAGDSWSDARSDPGFDDELWTCTGTSVEAVTIGAPDGSEDRANVVVMPTADGATVKWIGAPEMEAEGCA